MIDALKLAQKFYKQPNLRVSDVRPTKQIDSQRIASRFWGQCKVVRIHIPVGLEASFWAHAP